MLAALTINSMLFLLTVCRKQLGSFLLMTRVSKIKISFMRLQEIRRIAKLKSIQKYKSILCT